MSDAKKPDPKADDGLVTHVAKETPEEATAFWTEERLREARPIPMPGMDRTAPPHEAPPREDTGDRAGV